MSNPEQNPSKEFPPAVKKEFEELWHQVCLLHAHWSLYLGLFQPGQIEVARKTAEGTFALIERALRESMIMNFGRLADPAHSGKNENLSLKNLLLALEKHWRSLKEKNSAETLLDGVITSGKLLEEWRNKQIAHSDFETTLGLKPIPLADYQTITRTLKAIGDFMNKIEEAFTSQTTDYTVGSYGKDLITILRREHEES